MAGAPESSLPTGMLVMLVADVRGYTAFTHAHGDAAAANLAAHFAALAGEVVTAERGRVVEVRGDEVLAVFTSAREALRAGVALLARCAEQATADLPLRAGLGLDVGEPVPVPGGYRGEVINVAARLCAQAGPGQALASDAVISLARRVEGLAYEEHGDLVLKGLSRPVRAWSVRAETLAGAGSEQPTAAAPPAPALIPTGGYLGAMPEQLLVAREEELARLLAAVSAAGNGQGRCMLLAGEPGVGKTRLAQETSLRAREAGFLLLVGRCAEQDASTPFAPWLDVFAAALEHASPALRAAAPRRFAELALLLPEFGPATPLPLGEDPRRRIVAASGRFLAALAAETPLAVLVDDLHWADSASLELLAHLAHALRAERALLLGTYRDVEIGRQHPLEATLTGLMRDRVAEIIVLRGLRPAGTAKLICSRFGVERISDELRDLVHQRTEGNPFFTEEVLASLVEQGAIYREGEGWGRKEVAAIAVPQSIRSVVGQRVGRLSREGQELLTLASVLGQEFDPEVLLAAAGGDEEGALTQLDAALEARLLEQRRVGREDRYAFAHALIGQVLYDEVPRHRLRRMHLRAGEALERARAGRPEASPELARHFLAAGDSTRAARYALIAGERAAGFFAYEEAARHFETAADLLDELGEKPSAANARIQLGVALRHLSRTDQALAALNAALAAYEQLDDRAGQAVAERELGGLYHECYERGTASEHYAVALRLWPEGHDQPGLAYLLLDAYYTASLMGESREATPLAEQGLALAQAQDDLALRAHALSACASMYDMPTAIAMMGQAEPLARRANALRILYRIYNNRGYYRELAGELTEAVADCQRAIAVAEQAGAPGLVAHTLGSGLSRIYELTGAWAESRAALRRAGEISTHIARVGSDLLGVQGDHAAAVAQALPLIEQARRSADFQAEMGISAGLAERYLEMGRAADAEAVLRPVATRMVSRGFWGGNAYVFGSLAEAVVRSGAADAEAVLDEAEALVRRHGEFLATPRLLRARGLLLRGRGDFNGAQQALRASADTARRQGAVLELARTLHALAETARALDDESAASAADQERQAIVERIGPDSQHLSWAK